jgi:hypothetical protein
MDKTFLRNWVEEFLMVYARFRVGEDSALKGLYMFGLLPYHLTLWDRGRVQFY